MHVERISSVALLLASAWAQTSFSCHGGFVLFFFHHRRRNRSWSSWQKSYDRSTCSSSFSRPVPRSPCCLLNLQEKTTTARTDTHTQTLTCTQTCMHTNTLLVQFHSWPNFDWGALRAALSSHVYVHSVTLWSSWEWRVRLETWAAEARLLCLNSLSL